MSGDFGKIVCKMIPHSIANTGRGPPFVVVIAPDMNSLGSINAGSETVRWGKYEKNAVRIADTTLKRLINIDRLSRCQREGVLSVVCIDAGVLGFGDTCVVMAFESVGFWGTPCDLRVPSINRLVL